MKPGWKDPLGAFGAKTTVSTKNSNKQIAGAKE